jgi:hypothetical protein
MSKFQSTISTLAALTSIAVTAVGVYKAVDHQKQYAADQQRQIEVLQTQLKQVAPKEPVQVPEPPAAVSLPAAPQGAPLVANSTPAPVQTQTPPKAPELPPAPTPVTTPSTPTLPTKP